MHPELDDLAGRLRDRLVAEAGAEAPGDLAGRIAAAVERDFGLLGETERREVARRVESRVAGLGPLEPLLADPRVDEVMVNGRRAGVGGARRAASSAPDVRFADEAELRHAIERILAPLGRRVDEAVAALPTPGCPTARA